MLSIASVLTTISLCLLLFGGIFHSRIPFDVFVTIVFQRSVARLPLSQICIRGENRRVAITGRRYVMTHAMQSSSQSQPVINFHWPIVHSQFHNIKYHLFWTGYFCTPAQSLNTPRWAITRVLPGTECGTFVIIKFHWPSMHSQFHDIKYYVFWTGYFGTPARSLNTPRWVITRVLPGTDRRTFVMIVGALVTWAIYTQGQLLL